jgi:phosphoglycerate dehydrogenase-like enzyme
VSILAAGALDRAYVEKYLGPGLAVRPCPGLLDWRDAEYVVLWHDLPVDAATLAQMPRCRLIVRAGIGYDNVDVDAAAALGIAVAVIPDYGPEDVAELAFGLLLSLSRRLPAFQRALAQDGPTGWVPELGEGSFRLSGRRLGVAGLGRIGTCVTLRAKAFRMETAFYDPYLSSGMDKALGSRRAESLEELAQSVDILSLHCPLTGETRGMVDAALLSAARPGLVLINTARGGLVDTAAALDALEAGRLAGFGADVLAEEPLSPEAPITQRIRAGGLLGGKLVLSPHAGYFAPESRAEMYAKVRQALDDAQAGRPVKNCVQARAPQGGFKVAVDARRMVKR